jgi:tight adherence protein B
MGTVPPRRDSAVRFQRNKKMNIAIPALLIFVITVLVIEMFLYSYRLMRHPDRAVIRKKLRRIRSNTPVEGALDSGILRTRVFSDVPALNQLLLRVIGITRLDRLAQQANTRYPVGVFILLAIVLASTGFLAFSYVTEKRLLCVIISALLGAAPFLYLLNKKQKRMQKFQAQLPEALDMISRSMKAGHAFTTGMRLAADEFDDPLGTELSYTLDEINFGVSVPDALKSLVRRLNCKDLNFFVVSVILQRETGGNLAEIIEKIAHLIRERFKLLDKIKTLSAEGRLSAIILACIPFVVAGILYFKNPTYIMVLYTDPTGRIMATVVLCMVILGIYIMKRIVNIKV